jgi:hypothetical protein
MAVATTTLQRACTRILQPRHVLIWLCFSIVLVFANRAAQAETCGHYLYRNGKPVVGVHNPAHADAIAAAARHNETRPAAPKLPCSGPGCRKQAPPLLPAPAAPSSSVANDHLAILEKLLSAQMCLDSLSAPQSERGAVWIAGEVFRPPTV